jgi:hypothetical protein
MVISTVFSKICSECGSEIIFVNKYNLERSIRDNSLCKSCVCIVRNKATVRTGVNNSQWKGYKGIPYAWFSRYFERQGSKKKRTGTITIAQVYELWIQQGKKCKLSGVDIGFYDDNKTHTCSIDRIDSLLEYTLENIQLVHKDVNLMKNRFNNEYFIAMCKNIATTNK